MIEELNTRSVAVSVCELFHLLINGLCFLGVRSTEEAFEVSNYKKILVSQVPSKLIYNLIYAKIYHKSGAKSHAKLKNRINYEHITSKKSN